ncbi:anaerobic sulfite reductase subunit B [Peptacetobacter hominis]|uniref:Anaerobic sulfite reductase subunit B n=1 Tax=Peptacetobacter hominis TaxID=2743610 RepID=A0A544QT51_9FIRM|nr:anaerobic sulfite reductase subunit AsrB [Peptacetobacter hominis]TQQ83214.1 anaerobic sulfite reductase subunit B [Peptacetobacter hominis]
MIKNDYIPFYSEILDVIKHTPIEYTFRMSYSGDVKPGQFFEVSIPKYGEAPISVSGIGDGFIDLTIRRVGKVTNEIFENYIGDSLPLRGPYGNGFDIDCYKNKDIIVIAGGTGLSPVRGVVDYFSKNTNLRGNMTLICGFKTPDDILFKSDIEDWSNSMNLILTVDNSNGNSNYREGLVTKYIPNINWGDKSNTVAIIVGPPAMMKFSVLGLLNEGLSEKNIWISQERKMCCGLGKCGHCKVGNKYICLDGPVFNYVDGKSLID